MRATSASFASSALAALLGMLVGSAPARAAELDPGGHLVFANDALRTYGFESFAEARAQGASWLAWDGSTGALGARLVSSEDWAQSIEQGESALEGAFRLVLSQRRAAGLALRDDAFFQSALGQRIVVTMWGRAMGAEPVLSLVYARGGEPVGVDTLPHVIAIRTGRETSDGWVEYSTGPVDGALFGAPLQAIVLTARYTTSDGASVLTGSELSPTAPPPALLEPDALAEIDAVEVRRAEGRPMEPAACTQATVDAACGALGECVFGRCVDASVVWGPVPEAEDQRRDLVTRWAFTARSLIGDRRAAERAAALFSSQEAERLAGATTARAFYGTLNALVASLRDSHTKLGLPPSRRSVFYPLVRRWSGPLDACLGVVENDLAPGSPRAYAVFNVASKGAIREALQQGDVLTRIDGLPPDAWIAAASPRFRTSLPNDPAADPSATALVLSALIGRYAESVVFARCELGAGCSELPPIPVGEEVFADVEASFAVRGDSLACSPRFRPSVADPPDDGSTIDAVAVLVSEGVTNVQFNGFDGAYDGDAANPQSPWEDPMSAAFTDGAKVLVDARMGHGGWYSLGKWLFALLRGGSEPYGMFTMPRGAHDDPDPTWLFDARWDDCAAASGALDRCSWTGGWTSFTSDADPAGATAKIAWVNGNDFSVSDLLPRLLQSRSSVRIFGPHPTHGAYGAISAVPAIVGSWQAGSMQVFDTRFGPTPAAARSAPWESGKGVTPDEVVVQKVSDMLKGQDTIVAIARAWLSQ